MDVETRTENRHPLIHAAAELERAADFLSNYCLPWPIAMVYRPDLGSRGGVVSVDAEGVERVFQGEYDEENASGWVACSLCGGPPALNVYGTNVVLMRAHAPDRVVRICDACTLERTGYQQEFKDLTGELVERLEALRGAQIMRELKPLLDERGAQVARVFESIRSGVFIGKVTV